MSTLVNDPVYEEFESALGDVLVTDSFVEREEIESKWLDMIKEEFHEDELVSREEFSNIELVEFENGPLFPRIKVRTKNKWKFLFFHHENEGAENCFKRLKYRLNVYKQNYE